MFATWWGLITQQVPLSWSQDSNSVHVSNSLDVQKICPVYINDIQVLAYFKSNYMPSTSADLAKNYDSLKRSKF